MWPVKPDIIAIIVIIAGVSPNSISISIFTTGRAYLYFYASSKNLF